jgi:hypothetical protein
LDGAALSCEFQRCFPKIDFGARPIHGVARKAFGSKAISFGFFAITDPGAARHGRNTPMLVT